MKISLAIATASIALSSALSAQVPVAPSAIAPTQTAAVLEAPTQQNVLRSGTEIQLITLEDLTTEKKKLRVGYRFKMEVAANVELNGVVVIPAGTPAIGEVTEVRNKGMWGKSGYINGRVISLRLGDRTIRLTGTFDDKGVTGTAGVVGAVVFIPVAGFFMTGTSAKIPTGSGIKAFLDEDIPFRTVAVQPQVIEIPVQAPAPAPASAPAPINPASQTGASTAN